MILGFAYLEDPRDPQNFLFTDYQWWHIADYYATVTNDTLLAPDTSCTVYCSWFDPPLFGWNDGVHAEIPGLALGCIRLINSDYLAGDINGSADVNGLDVVWLVNYLKGYGPPPVPILRGDTNGDCSVNGLDVVYLVNYLKGLGSLPRLGDCN
jgi:hypothetical protein